MKLKNRTLLTATLALCLGLGASCSEGSVSGSELMENVKSMDVSNLSVDALKGKVPDMVKGLTEKLGGITDLESAKAAVAKIAPTLTSMTAIKEKLGENMPDLSALTDTIATLKDKFAGNSSIMSVLDPIIKTITGLMK